ncbi:MAG: GIY-YIG nuclease family protein [Parcubacteria group bacterium]|nr:GIY-YIG nuclease family protein [Parcubacteria group bacterium]
MYYVYILKSGKDNKLYIGSTNNLRKQFEEHNHGLVKSTRSRVPLKLMYYEAYLLEKDARYREHNLKLRKRAWVQLKKRIEESLKN